MSSFTSQLALGALLSPFPTAGTTGRSSQPVSIYMGSGEPKLWSSALTTESSLYLRMDFKGS